MPGKDIRQPCCKIKNEKLQKHRNKKYQQSITKYQLI